MKTEYFNVAVKENEKWTSVGQAWLSKSGKSLNLRLTMHPNQIFVVQEKRPKTKKENKNV